MAFPIQKFQFFHFPVRCGHSCVIDTLLIAATDGDNYVFLF
jgi:hypothetical protein